MNLSDNFPAIFRTGIPWKTVDFPVFRSAPPIGRPERKTSTAGMETFFDQSQRPVQTVDFDYGALDPGQQPDQQLKDRLAMSEYFRQRYEWIMAGRTRQSRRIRQAIVQAQVDGIGLAAIAKRFGVTRQAVYDQAKTAPKLDAIFHR
jgi:hypothetical protein